MSRSNLSTTCWNLEFVGRLPLLVLGHDHSGRRERHDAASFSSSYLSDLKFLLNAVDHVGKINLADNDPKKPANRVSFLFALSSFGELVV